jgi:hypothetical protein
VQLVCVGAPIVLHKQVGDWIKQFLRFFLPCRIGYNHCEDKKKLYVNYVFAVAVVAFS